MIGDAQRQELTKLARERAQGHPAEVERALQLGMSAFRRRIALTYTVTCTLVVAVAIVLGASISAIGDASAKSPDKITLQTIAVKPQDRVLAIGETVRFAAVATFSDHSVFRVTRKVRWSSNSKIIRITKDGRASAVSTGEATITARWAAISGTTDVTVTKAGASLRSIAVNPPRLRLQPDESRKFRAVGSFADDTSRDITRNVSWSTSDPGAVRIDNAGHVTAVGPGTATITARWGKRRDVATVVVTSPDVTLLGITIDPPNVTLRQGEHTTFVATAHYTDGKTQEISRDVDWAALDRKTVQIDQNGNATAISRGSTTIVATLGIRSASADVTVRALPRVLTRVDVSPATNEWCNDSATQQLTATAIYNDGTNEPLEGRQVRWSSSDTAVATVDATGFVSSPAEKTDDPASISAEIEGVVGYAKFACTPVE